MAKQTIDNEPVSFDHGDGFIITVDGSKFYADDHPWVLMHPELFEDADFHIIPAP